MGEPRFLLDEDSICYGCEYYKNIDDVVDNYVVPEENIDENGGICNCYCPCIGGSMNGYRMED